jgi:hypothetical protein
MLAGVLHFTNILYNMFVGGRAQHLDMSRCWALAKIVVQHVRCWSIVEQATVIRCSFPIRYINKPDLTSNTILQDYTLTSRGQTDFFLVHQPSLSSRVPAPILMKAQIYQAIFCPHYYRSLDCWNSLMLH